MEIIISTMSNIIVNSLQRLKNNTRFYKSALQTYYKNNDKKFGVSDIDFLDVRRVLNPPTTLINAENMKSTTIDIVGREAKIKYLHTQHGIYVKLSEPISCANVEHAFGFGCACIGFDPDKIVYYPNHTRRYA